MEHYVFRTYRAVWNWSHKIYMLGDIRLFQPISMVYSGCLLGAALLTWFFSHVRPFHWFVHALGLGVLPYLAAPFLIAHLLTRATLDGRNPAAWLKAQFLFLWQPQVWQGNRPVPTWWMLLPPSATYRIWNSLGWSPLPLDKTVKLHVTGAAGR